jgi:23S rRNA (uracil1939-C5)-methyltransferase
MRKRRGAPTAAPTAKKPPVETASIERLSHDLRGIAHRQGKIVFIDNALPGETLRFQTTSTRSRFDEGVAIEILQASADRCEPPCPHAIECGGCSLQHMQPAIQIIEKQKILLDQLARFGDITVPEVLPPLTAEPFFYRRKARIGVRFLKGKGKDKGGLVIGFREKRSNTLAPINECHILHRIIAEQIPQLKELLGKCDGRAHFSQLEVAIGEDRSHCAAPPATPI